MTGENGVTRREFDRLEREVTERARMRDVDQLGKEVEGLAEEVKGLRRVIVGFSFTVAVSAIGVAGAVLMATGGQ